VEPEWENTLSTPTTGGWCRRLQPGPSRSRSTQQGSHNRPHQPKAKPETLGSEQNRTINAVHPSYFWCHCVKQTLRWVLETCNAEFLPTKGWIKSQKLLQIRGKLCSDFSASTAHWHYQAWVQKGQCRASQIDTNPSSHNKIILI